MNPTDQFYSVPLTLDIEGEQVDSTLVVTEGGKKHFDVPHRHYIDEEPNHEIDRIYGQTGDGGDVEIKNAILRTGKEISRDSQEHYVDNIDFANEVHIEYTDFEPFIDEELIVSFDVLCLHPRYPITGSGSPITLIERDNWKAQGNRLGQMKERIDFIKTYQTPLRSGTIDITQRVNGPSDRQIRFAREKVVNLLELSSFFHGVGHAPIRAQLFHPDEIEEPLRVSIWSPQCDIGGAYKTGSLGRIDLPEFLDEIYDDYTNSLRDNYRLHMVIGYYLDSIDPRRSVQGRLSTLFSAIELLAKRHSDIGPDLAKTIDRIEHMVQTLDVEVEDLAEASGTFHTEQYSQDSEDDQNLSPAYFYNRSRQYVAHGDGVNSMSLTELVLDLHAVTVFLQRLIRNRLFSDKSFDHFPGLVDLSPNTFHEYE